MSGKHFTLEDRINILMHVRQNHSMRMIAAALNASASTVSRELEKHRILDEYSVFHPLAPTCSR
ncbi:helix-turn-helix domain-containing protein, partial [Solobacterium moorei]